MALVVSRLSRFFRQRPHLAALGGMASGLTLFGLFYQPVVVQGCSMQPTFRSGQLLLADRQHYRFHSFEPGDIVIFRYEDDVYIKRVYATAGSAIRVACLRNGCTTLLDQVGAPAKVLRLLRMHPNLGFVRLQRVPDGHLFVVGDNAAESMDSRDFGPIPADSVLGYIRPPSGGTEAPWEQPLHHRQVARR